MESLGSIRRQWLRKIVSVGKRQSSLLITVNYTREHAEWAVTLTCLDRMFTTRAPGIVDARNRVDRLVQELAGNGLGGTAVHLINGSAVEFTQAYLNAQFSPSSPSGQGKTADAAPGNDVPHTAASTPEGDATNDTPSREASSSEGTA